jgi:hypothetical protein
VGPPANRWIANRQSPIANRQSPPQLQYSGLLASILSTAPQKTTVLPWSQHTHLVAADWMASMDLVLPPCQPTLHRALSPALLQIKGIGGLKHCVVSCPGTTGAPHIIMKLLSSKAQLADVERAVHQLGERGIRSLAVVRLCSDVQIIHFIDFGAAHQDVQRPGERGPLPGRGNAFFHWGDH